MKISFTILTFLLFLTACNKEKVDPIDNNPSPTDPTHQEDGFIEIVHNMNDLEMLSNFEQAEQLGGVIQTPSLNEASGLAVSRQNPSILYSHNDSGHPNWLYAIGINGENYGYFSLSGAGSRDYEDICIGPGPIEGVNYIYLADIGDNDAQYSFVIVYRFPEPDLSQITEGGTYSIPSDQIERIELTYPDGPRDAETIMIDPWTKDLYIVSKRGFRSLVYRAKYPQQVGARTEMEKLAQLPFNWALGGDISADGKMIAIKDRTRIFYWEREQNETVIQALTKKPKTLPYVLEPQGESFAWSPDGNRYFTLSEQSGIHPPPLYVYQRVE